MNKSEILNAIINVQEKTLVNLKNSIEKLKVASDIDEDNTLDPEDFSHQDEAKNMQLHYEGILKKEIKNKETLLKCNEITTNQVEFGSLVDLGDRYLFIGISTHPFKLENKAVYTISEQAPIYLSIKGKKVGDEIELGNEKFKILEIQ